tara:strand:+ start:407 stop:838 length:432 start_codon:yes stop_codon:yes gene_type:complete
MDDVDIHIRSVKQTDMTDVIELLQSVSKFEPSKKDYISIWEKFCKQANVHSLVATIDGKIVGYGSVVIELTIRGGKLGYVTDIVSHNDFRSKGIGKIIVDSLYNVARENDCYKVVLQCNEPHVGFYKQCNYHISGISMRRFVE